MSNQVINFYEVKNDKIIYKAGIIKESMLSSIISDIFTFLMIISSFWINAHFIHSRAMSVLLLFMLIFSFNFGSRKRNLTKEEFKKVMNQYLDEIP